MKKPLKVSLWIVGIIVGLILAAVIVVKVVFTKERILAMLKPHIEAAVNRPVSIGDAGISLWGGIGVWLGDVTVGNREGFSPEPLLAVHKLEFKAHFWPLLAGRVELDRVILQSPSLLLEYNELDQSNLEGLMGKAPAPDTGMTGTEEPIPEEAALAAPVVIDHFVLENGELVVRHAVPERRLDVGGFNLDLRTEARTPKEVTGFWAELSVDSIVLEGIERSIALHEGKPRVYLEGELNRAQKDVRFDSVNVEWLGASIALEGRLRQHPALTEVQLNAHLAPTQLGDIVSEAVRAGVIEKEFALTGQASGTAQIDAVWPLPVGTVPEWHARFELGNLNWKPMDALGPITIPRLELRGEERAISWNAQDGSMPGGTFSLTGAIDELFAEDREISAHLVTNADLSAFDTYTSSEFGLGLLGELRADVSAFGQLKEWRQLQVNGSCRAPSLTLIDSLWTVDTLNLNLDLKLKGHDLGLENVQWRAGHSSGSMTGNVAGMMPAAFDGFEPPHVLRAELDMHCPYLNLDELIGEEAPDSLADSTLTDTTVADTTAPALERGVPFPALSATGTIACDTVLYSEMTLTNVESPLVFRENVLTLDPISGRVYGGRAQGAYRWDVSDWEAPAFAAKFTADSIEANDFAERYLGWAGGIFGALEFSGEFAGQGRDESEILPTLVGNGKASMRAGRLEAAPLLARLGQALGINGMDRSRAINDLFARFRIENGRLFTDSLRLVTDDARWAALGSYGFDGSLDYVADMRYTGSQGAGFGDLLKQTDIRFRLRGTVDQPRVDIEAADAARGAIEKLLIPPSKDTTSAEDQVRDLLKDLFNKKKP
jgi:uncharacterized protein involved in outer membrane biogenesis